MEGLHRSVANNPQWSQIESKKSASDALSCQDERADADAVRCSLSQQYTQGMSFLLDVAFRILILVFIILDFLS